MIAINFTDSPLYLKGEILAKGVNILSDTQITESDQCETLGIGQEALNHYNALVLFWESAGFYDGVFTDRIKSLHAQVEHIDLRIKQMVRNRMETNTTEAQDLILSLTQDKKRKVDGIKKFFGIVELKKLSENELVTIELMFSNTHADKFSFRQSKYALQAMETIRNTKAQTLPYQLHKIKAKYGIQ